MYECNEAKLTPSIHEACLDLAELHSLKVRALPTWKVEIRLTADCVDVRPFDDKQRRHQCGMSWLIGSDADDNFPTNVTL